MRRHIQKIEEQKTYEYLLEGKTGILSLCDDNQPYGLPINYAVKDDEIIIHIAKEGKKIDILKKNNKVSFCVVNKDEILPEVFSTSYISVIVSGEATIVEDEKIKHECLIKLCEKYSPNHQHLVEKEIKSAINYCEIVTIKIKEITGKQSKDLVNK